MVLWIPHHARCEEPSWQLWSYSLALVPGVGMVDPLSLTLSLQANADDRVRIALGELEA